MPRRVSKFASTSDANRVASPASRASRPAAAIDALYARIERDHRHGDVSLLLTTEVDERMFPNWAMLDDQSPSLFWSPEEVKAGALEAATPAELRAAFEKLT